LVVLTYAGDYGILQHVYLLGSKWIELTSFRGKQFPRSERFTQTWNHAIIARLSNAQVTNVVFLDEIGKVDT
jgi:hypothetical protein